MSKAKQTKRQIANGIFNKALEKRGDKTDAEFRKGVLVAIEKRVGANRPQAATLYNFAKKSAVAAGLTQDFSRSARQASLPQPAEGDKYRAVDADGNIVAFGTNKKNLARENKGCTVEAL